jgi:hypothetical protein
MQKPEDHVQLPGISEYGQPTYMSIFQGDISGGRVAREKIDTLREHPDLTGISVSGFTQASFEYFIHTYGGQFKTIIFWKCPLIGNLEALETLDQVEQIYYYWNQRAETLWDFSKTRSLKVFRYDDFTRMHDLSQISKAPALEELHFGNKVWSKYILNTLEPLKDCPSLKNVALNPRKILDERIEPLAELKKLEELHFSSRLFTTEQIAWLKAHLPASFQSTSLEAFWKIKEPLSIHGKRKDTFVAGKGKPFLDPLQDKARLEKYVQQFNDMHQWFLEHPKASPQDYKRKGQERHAKIL